MTVLSCWQTRLACVASWLRALFNSTGMNDVPRARVGAGAGEGAEVAAARRTGGVLSVGWGRRAG